MSTCILRGGSSGGDDVKCPTQHDAVATGLAVFLLVGIVVSYLPQVVRIIVKKSSLGFSPWFLLLGATSSASSFLNVVALQWGLVRCCSMVSTSICAESLLGIAQVALQWLCFVLILVLYLIYYPKDLRYERSIALPGSSRRSGEFDRYEDEPGDSAWSEDVADLEDGSTLDSQFEQNYSNLHLPDASGISVSGFEGTPTQSAVQRFHDEQIRGQSEDASSSAFARLVPTFWPMWKAPPKSEPAGRRSVPSGGAAGSPLGRQTASGSYSPIGAGEAITPPNRPIVPSGDGSQLLHTALNNAHAQYHGRSASTEQTALRAWKKATKQKTRRRSAEWSLSVALAWVVLLHFLFIFLITLLLVVSLPTSSFPDPSDPAIPSPIPPPPNWLSHAREYILLATGGKKLPSGSELLVQRWATFLGVTGTVLAAGQYVPQIVYTARSKLVGSLSIPMMCLQVPGSIIFVYSLAIRPGTNWTSLAAFIATGVLQLVLVILCFVWKARQKRMGIDDFGRALSSLPQQQQSALTSAEGSIRLEDDD